MVMNIVYSTVVACLVEVFLIANVSMISELCAGDAVPGFFFPAPDGDRDTDGICLSSVGHRDLLSHFFCPPGAVHALYQPDLVRDSEYFRGRFEYDDRGAGRRRVYGDGGQFK